jgi:PAS domain S-box-containing protein
MADRTPLSRDFIETQEVLPHTTPCHDAVVWFLCHPQTTSVSVVTEDAVAGLLNREKLFLHVMGAVSSQQAWQHLPIAHLVSPQYAVTQSTLRADELLGLLLKAHGTEPSFYEDFVVQQDGELLGVGSSRKLALTALHAARKQLTILERQSEFLTQNYKELIAVTNQLSQRQQLIESTFEANPLPMIVFTLDGLFVDANPAFYVLSGYMPGELNDSVNLVHLFGGSVERVLREPNANDPNPPSLTSLFKDGSQSHVEVRWQRHPGRQQVILSILRTVDFEAERARFNESDPYSGLDFELRGRLGEISVLDLCQLLLSSRKTGMLHLEPNLGSFCRIFFEHGRMTHAASRSSEGLKALRTAVALKNATFIYANGLTAPRDSISEGGIEALLSVCTSNDLDIAALASSA